MLHELAIFEISTTTQLIDLIVNLKVQENF